MIRINHAVIVVLVMFCSQQWVTLTGTSTPVMIIGWRYEALMMLSRFGSVRNWNCWVRVRRVDWKRPVVWRSFTGCDQTLTEFMFRLEKRLALSNPYFLIW